MKTSTQRNSTHFRVTTLMRNSLTKALMSLLFFYLMTLNLLHAQPYHPTTENLKNREWFENAKFGLFIHWGFYSVLGDGEWVMNQQQIPIKTYEKIPSFFNPTEFDSKAWVQMAKQGNEVNKITSKHHDGFASG